MGEWRLLTEAEERFAQQKEQLLATVDMSHINSPPCRDCKYWGPRMCIEVYDGKLTLAGTRACQAASMYNDFSCFEEKENQSKGG